MAKRTAKPEPEPEPVVPATAATTPPIPPLELDRRPESTAIRDFRPFDKPALPKAFKAAAGHATTDEAVARDHVTKYRRYVRYGEKNAEHLLPKYKEQLVAAEAELAEASARVKQVEQALEALYKAHAERVEQYWGAALQEALERVPYSVDPRLIVSRVEAGQLIVDIVDDRVRLLGPKVVTDGEDRVITGSRVSWGATAAADADPLVAVGFGQALTLAGQLATSLDHIVEV